MWGYFPVNAEGNDLVIYTDDARTTERMRFSFPRQAKEPFLCISGLFRPADSGAADYAAFQIVTVGAGASERTAELFASDRYRDYVVTHGLSVEMTEALAELWHRRIREEWGFADEDAPTLTGLFRQQHRGGRYSFGYPACPDLEDNAKVVELLEAERIGIDGQRGIPASPGAVDTGHRLPSPEGQVLRRLSAGSASGRGRVAAIGLQGLSGSPPADPRR